MTSTGPSEATRRARRFLHGDRPDGVASAYVFGSHSARAAARLEEER